MDWMGWAEWFKYGNWEKAGLLGRQFQWRFDKKRIQHKLNTNLHSVRLCPFLERKLCDAVLKKLPETVNPDSDSDWDYARAYDEAPGSIKIVETGGEEGFTFRSEFWSDGVFPRGTSFYKRLLLEAFKESGYSGCSVKQLLK